MTPSPWRESLPPVCILAGGLGTRLGEATRMVPKPLVEVAGRPFLFHVLEYLRAQGIDRVVLCVGYLGELIESAVGAGGRFGLAVSYSYDGPTVIGTAAAIRQARPLLEREFFVLYGDTYLRVNYRDVAQAFRESELPALMTVLRNRGRWDASNASFDGRLVHYRKGSAELEWIDYGLSMMSHEALDESAGHEADLSAVFERLSAEGRLGGFEATARFYEIGTPTALQETENFLLDQVGQSRS